MRHGTTPRIPRRHPLRRLFRELVWRRLVVDALLADPDIAEYIAALLADFSHVDNLYRIRGARGQPLEEVGAMLVESNPLLDEGGSFDREREVRKHVGDFTLFFTGLFPEWLESQPRRRRVRLDAFVDFVAAGKESYAIVAEFNQFEFRDEAPLFRRLSEGFELCVFGLSRVREDLRRLRPDGLDQMSLGLG